MLMLSDLSINSIDCAVALSSSISNTRMQVPFVATLDSRSAGLSAAFVILGQSDSRYAIDGWLIRPYRRRESDLRFITRLPRPGESDPPILANRLYGSPYMRPS